VFRIVVFDYIILWTVIIYYFILKKLQDNFGNTKGNQKPHIFLTFTFTEYGTVLTTILPILFLYLNTFIVTAGAFEP
jgi:hypothetical protein